MLNPMKTKAEQQFAATQKKTAQALKDKEQARQEKAKLVASLRGRGLAKEAADKEATEKANA